MHFLTVLILAISQWQGLIDRVIQEGSVYDDGREVIYGLARAERADGKGGHASDYLSVVGHNGEDGFIPFRVESVTEQWSRLSNGNWEIDQWLHSLYISGEIRTLSHYQIVKTPTGKVVQHQRIPTGAPDSPPEQERWRLKRAEWYDIP